VRPLRRSAGLIIRELGDETLVYERERHRAHCLNPTTAAVFRLCDGTRSALEIAVATELPGSPEGREALVRVALAQLAAASLVQDADEVSGAAVGATGAADPAAETAAGDAHRSSDVPAHAARRQLLLRVGAALVAPAIATIIAPTPAQAASGFECLQFGQCPEFTGVYHRCSVSGTGNCTGLTECGTCSDSSTDCVQGGPMCF
jgi:hypothetical protein